MKTEYIMLIVYPLVIGYIGERYKDMAPLKFGLCIFLMLLTVDPILYLFDGGNFFPDKTNLLLYLFGGIFAVLMFYAQQKIRKKNKQSFVG